jgi:hypothetical protein
MGKMANNLPDGEGLIMSHYFLIMSEQAIVLN